MEESSIKESFKDRETNTPEAEKEPYHRPELTKHQQLTEITLGIQCGGSFPPCSPLQDPFN